MSTVADYLGRLSGAFKGSLDPSSAVADLIDAKIAAAKGVDPQREAERMKLWRQVYVAVLQNEKIRSPPTVADAALRAFDGEFPGADRG